jgi:hypothetical protein
LEALLDCFVWLAPLLASLLLDDDQRVKTEIQTKYLSVTQWRVRSRIHRRITASFRNLKHRRQTITMWVICTKSIAMHDNINHFVNKQTHRSLDCNPQFRTTNEFRDGRRRRRRCAANVRGMQRSRSTSHCRRGQCSSPLLHGVRRQAQSGAQVARSKAEQQQCCCCCCCCCGC